MSDLLSDKSRFKAILEIFPESLVDNLVNGDLYNAHYPKELVGIFAEYVDHKKEELSSFPIERSEKLSKK